MRRPLLSLGRRVRFRHVKGALAGLRPGTALDAGCGDAHLAAWLARRWPRCRVVGLDSDESELARGRAGGRDLENLDLRRREIGGERLAERFDLIVCVDVLEHVNDPDRALAWLAGHLAPGGTLAVHVPATPQRHPLRSVAAAMEAEVAGGRGPHLREGFGSDELEQVARRAELTEARVSFTFHRALVRLAADFDTWTYLHRARALKAVMLPLLLPASAAERRPAAHRAGNGLLLVARRPGDAS